jgi:tetratricopeptide (TPR) repeat protein
MQKRTPNCNNASPPESPATDATLLGRPWLLALVLVVATLVAYMPAMHAGFVWDDEDHLTTNPAMSSAHGLRLIWSSLAVSRYYPLTLTTFWVQRRFWGLNPMPYHLVNVALHAINGILVFLVLRRLRIPAAWLAAMLWVLHPVNVGSAAWITELKNTQSGAFFFLAVLCFLLFEGSGKHESGKPEIRKRQTGETAATNGWYALALLCGLAAMLSKPSTVILPLALLLCAWWQRGGWRRADIRRIAPFFILALGMSALTIIEQRGHVLRAGTTEWNLSMAERLVIAGRAVWFYAAKLLWPAQLMFVYPRWAVDAEALSAWMPLAALIGVGIVLWRWRRQAWARAGVFGLGFFVAALLPVLGFFDVYYFRFSFVADHFQYLAGAGLIALVVSAGIRACRRAGHPGRQLGMVVALIMLTALASLTWTRVHTYRDEVTLWQDTLAKNPQCWLAHTDLGYDLSKLGRVQEALSHEQKAVRLNPNYVEARNDLGVALQRAGRLQEAITQYQSALRIKPDSAEAHCNFGNALFELGKFKEAVGHYEQALQIKPGYARANLNLTVAQYRLANALDRTGRSREAIGHYEQAIRLQPDFADACNDLAWLLATHVPAEGGDVARAVDLAQRACELTDNRRAGHLDTLAAAYAAAGRFREAVATAEKAIELARTASPPKAVGEYEARLELYRSGRAYRQTIETAAPNKP